MEKEIISKDFDQLLLQHENLNNMLRSMDQKQKTELQQKQLQIDQHFQKIE